MNDRITIIGGGNLGSAIAEGLINSKFCKAGTYNQLQKEM